MRSLRSLASRGAVAALSAAIVSGCVGAPPAMAADAQDSRLTWAVHVTLAARWLDPGETEAAITPFLVLYAMHDALVKPMPGGGMTASLAEAWTMSPDGRTYEFRLRPNLRFHNGDPITAADVKFSFERYQGGGAALLKERAMLQQIQRILHDRVVFAPVWENALLRASGPRVEEPGLTLIPAYPYSAPYEDLALKRN